MRPIIFLELIRANLDVTVIRVIIQCLWLRASERLVTLPPLDQSLAVIADRLIDCLTDCFKSS